MRKKTFLRNLLLFALTLVIPMLTIVALGQTHPSMASRETLVDSSLPASIHLPYPVPPTATPTQAATPTRPPYPILPTPTQALSPSTPTPPLPTPTTQISGPTQYALTALTYIANQNGIPADVLRIVADHTTKYPNLGRQFQVVTVLDTRPQGQAYKLLVDSWNGRIEEDVASLLAAEDRAYKLRYGKLQPALYERLQALNDDETLPVAVWVAAGSGQSLAEQQAAAFAMIGVKYPEVQAAMERFGKPMDVSDRELRQRVRAEYIELLVAQGERRTRSLLAELERRGASVTTYRGMPFFTTILPKRLVLELNRRSDVSAIYLTDAKAQPALDSAVPTTLAPIVWARGYDGSGVFIAILEHGNVATDNTFLHLSPIRRVADNGVQDHTTYVASAAASFHDTYRGVAPGATILSAGEDGTEADIVSALQWALDQGADVVNHSEGFILGDNMEWVDRAFDYWARQRFRAIVAVAGNEAGSIRSPGKAWNVITVGATDDRNTVAWPDDQIAWFSSFVNPVSPNNDREKPEVVAVGMDITALGVGNGLPPDPLSGTSFAAPQVAGLVALLIHRNDDLINWPEAAKAIVMASATHNIEGPTIITPGQGDLRDGAGAINAALADTVAQLRADVNTTCYEPCWWGHYISNVNFPTSTDMVRTFYAEQGDLIRVAIAWWAHADSPDNNYSFSQLDTDLDLRIKDPSDNLVTSSVSWDNNYEMVEFAAPRTGVYKIAIRKERADESSNYLGIAFLRLHRIYLPIVTKGN